MSNNHDQQAVEVISRSSPYHPLLLLKKLAIWGLFFFVIYLTRDFFFLAFMTFLLSYMALSFADILGQKMRLSSENSRSRRLLIVGIFILIPLILFTVGAMVLPHLINQGQQLIGWVSQTNPETEVARVLEKYVGQNQFKSTYGNPQDPRFQKAFEDYRKNGQHYVAEYETFPQLVSWIEGGFSRQYDSELRAKLQTRLLSEGVSSKGFEVWLFNTKLPAFKAQMGLRPGDKNTTQSTIEKWLQTSLTMEPNELINKIRHDQALQAPLQKEWIKDTIEETLRQQKDSANYQDQFRVYFDTLVKSKQSKIPYTYEQYLELQKARPQGQAAFSAAMTKIKSATGEQSEEQLMRDFEVSKRHELFENWWSTSSPAKFIRHELDFTANGNYSSRLEGLASSLLNIPIDLTTAMLLSLLICIDFPALKRASQRLRNTWLREVYDELVPALARLGHLIGKAMYAQGLVALCNAILLYVFMEFLDIEHAVLLAFAVFVVCLVPTLGAIIAWVLIALMALVQPGGGVALALKATGAVAIVMVLETVVFSPRILGKLMELHPVLIIAILPVAHYFFGIWGLILAVPVAVYVINEVILVDFAKEGTATADPVNSESRTISEIIS